MPNLSAITINGVTYNINGGGGGTSDYSQLTNKPQINGNELSGDKTSSQLGLASASDIPDVSTKYDSSDTLETILNDDDKVPFYDDSASAKRNSTWSNIKAKLKAYFDTIYSTFSGSYNDLTDKPTLTTTTVGSASTGTAISADDITAWSAGTTPTLGTAISADDITAWDAGSVPTLGTAISADDITAWSAGSAASATASGGVVTFTNGSAPSLTYTARSIPNVTSVGTKPSLSYTARSIPNVTNVGTLPSLSYTARSIPNISVTNKTVVNGMQ